MATTLLVPGLDGGGAGHWLSWFETAVPNPRRVVQPDLTKTRRRIKTYRGVMIL